MSPFYIIRINGDVNFPFSEPRLSSRSKMSTMSSWVTVSVLSSSVDVNSNTVFTKIYPLIYYFRDKERKREGDREKSQKVGCYGYRTVDSGKESRLTWNEEFLIVRRHGSSFM